MLDTGDSCLTIPPVKIADRIKNLQESATLALAARAAELVSRGVDLANFGAGEPDFDTPEHIKQSAVEAIRAGFTKYTASSGIPELRKAIAEKFERDQGLHYESSQIVVSCGSKHSIYNLLQALCDPGDEVLIPSPYWVSYPEMVKSASAVPVAVPTREEEGFRIDPAELEKRLTARTKVLLLNSPSNPTGAVASRKDLEAAGELVLSRNLIVISDEIYEKLVYPPAEHVSIATLSSKLKERTVIVNGVSKAYAMTGWRIGYAAGPAEILSAAGKLQSQATSNPASISQKAALAALQGDQKAVEEMRREYHERRDLVLGRLRGLPLVKCAAPAGAFYVYPNVSGLFGKRIGDRPLRNADGVAEALLDLARVVVVSGTAFGTQEHIRLSYAVSRPEIEKGMNRLEEFLRKVR